MADLDPRALRDLGASLINEGAFMDGQTVLAAADTIDALRAVRDMEDFDAGWLAAEARFKGERDEARAEVARLRAALTAVVSVPAFDFVEMTSDLAGAVREMKRIASAALGEGTDD